MNPLMGVLIVDYEHGARTLQLTGRAEIVEDSLGIPGAQRAFKFSIDEFVYVSHDPTLLPCISWSNQHFRISEVGRKSLVSD